MGDWVVVGAVLAFGAAWNLYDTKRAAEGTARYARRLPRPMMHVAYLKWGAAGQPGLHSADMIIALALAALFLSPSPAEAATCLPSPAAVREMQPNAWPRWTYGPNGERCWHAGKRPVISTTQVATQQVSTKQVSTKQASTRHGSTMRPAASTDISTGPTSRTVIPLPDQQLLAPLPEFDCQFKTSSLDDASGQPQPSPTRAQTDPSTYVALRTKLDYERQCHQHAQMILRDRLRHLQASIGETIKVAISTEPSARALNQLPDQAVMTPPPEFDCEFKTSSQSSPSPTSPETATDAVLRMKLDYERQCHKHGAMILRDRLRHLQASVDKMIKAAKR